MYSFRKSKKGFTLIELMVVVAIIGVLALLGLRLYTGQQDKAKNAIVKANAGTIQTLIQAELADDTAATVEGNLDTIFDDSGIHNPFGEGDHTVNAEQTTNAVDLATASRGEVYASMDASTFVFTINGKGADNAVVYDTALSAQP